MADLPNLTSAREVVSLLENNGLKPLRQLGQNFLIDGNIVEKILQGAAISPDEAVVEIGPGVGALTQRLALRRAQVLALELDRGLFKLLNNLFQPFPKVRIIHQDALTVRDWPSLCAEHFGSASVKLLSNLPYNISSPLMFALFKQGFPFERAVLMFQKEVAQRLLAGPNSSSYGSLSVICSYYTKGSFLFNVSRHVFWPRPGVDSAVIILEKQSATLTPEEEQVFWKVVQDAFQFRRKTLLNALQKAFPWPKETTASLLQNAGINLESRPETLSVSQFANLSRIIYNYLGTIN